MLTREESTVVSVDTDTRRATVRLCRWNEPRDVSDSPGGKIYREAYPPGSLDLAPNVQVVNRHGGDLIGRADPATFADSDDGPTVDLVLARTAAGNDTLALIDAGVIRSVSMELEPIAHRDAGGVVWRERSRLHGIAFAFRPAHDAPILATREQENQPMTDTLTDTAPTVASVTADVLERELGGIRDEIARAALAPAAGYTGPPAHPLALYRSFVDYADAVYAGDAEPNMLMRALADQITTANPGVIPPGWVNNVFGILEQSRPLIDAFGTEPLPDGGMDVNWPYFNGDLLTLVGEQLTQKTAITSVVVNLLKGTAPLHTYAGGSDISYQLIRRSSPAYRDAYLRIMTAAYAAVTDKAAGTLMLAVPGRGNITLDPLTATADTLRSALFAASAKVELATGTPATFVLASPDVFVKIGGLPNLFPAMYGTANANGTADAASLRIEVSGLEIINDPFLPAGSLHVSNGQAASWFEDGPMIVSADDPEKLGENVAVWGMGTFGAHVPKGIVQLSTTPPPPDPEADDTSSKKK